MSKMKPVRGLIIAATIATGVGLPVFPQDVGDPSLHGLHGVVDRLADVLALGKPGRDRGLKLKEDAVVRTLLGIGFTPLVGCSSLACAAAFALGLWIPATSTAADVRAPRLSITLPHGQSIKGARQIAAKIYAKGRQGGCLKEVVVRSYSKSPME